MANSNVRVIDHVTDVHGAKVPVGQDYDGVSIGGRTFSLAEEDHLMLVLMTAFTEARMWAEANASEASDG